MATIDTLNKIEKELYNIFHVKLHIPGRILGGLPMSKDLIESFLKGKAKTVASKAATEEEQEKAKKDIAENVLRDDYVSEETEKSTNTFKADDDGIYLEERNFKAMLKEAAFTLQKTMKRGFKHGLHAGSSIVPERIHPTRDGEPIKEVDGYEERAIHVVTRQGPRSALKKSAFLENIDIEFDLLVASPSVSKKDLIELFTVAQRSGLGASRSQGYGKFKLIEFVKTHGRLKPEKTPKAK